MAVYKTKDKTGNEKKNHWTIRFYYKDWQGITCQKKKTGFRTKKEAVDYQNNFIEIQNKNNDMLFKNLIVNYYEFIESRLKETTVANKKLLIDSKLQPYFGNMKLSEIEASTVAKWQNELIAQGYKPTYLKSIHNQLSAIFNFAIKFYKHTSNPARICGSMGTKKAKAMDFYTYDEFKKFIAVFEDDEEVKLMLNIMFFGGVRLGEMLALVPKNFNFKKNLMHIDESFSRLNKKNLIYDPKWDSFGTISMPEKIMIDVKKYLDKHYEIGKEDFIFNRSKSFLHTKMTKGAKEAGLKRIRVHDLRHSHASHLICVLNVQIKVVQSRLRHKIIQTTLDTYAHLYPNTDSDVAEKLNKLL